MKMNIIRILILIYSLTPWMLSKDVVLAVLYKVYFSELSPLIGRHSAEQLGDLLIYDSNLNPTRSGWDDS